MSNPEETSASWRVIQSPPAEGAWNMAVDEAILEAAAQGKSPPTLRLYAWDPPCLSLGYAQPFTDIDLPRSEERGWQVVRRPTGGRAILHTDELTYSVSGSEENPILAGDILTSYKRISKAILAAVEQIGLVVQALPTEKAPSGTEPEPICFEVPSNYEITVDGKKLVGSAQSRRRGGVLQHGTLPLYGDLARITQALSFPDEASRQAAAQRVLGRAATVESGLGKSISWQQAADAFQEAFSRTLNLALVPGELSAAELGRAEILVQEKYSSPEWTRRI
jgi:lipoate-protein ligase A